MKQKELLTTGTSRIKHISNKAAINSKDEVHEVIKITFNEGTAIIDSFIDRIQILGVLRSNEPCSSATGETYANVLAAACTLLSFWLTFYGVLQDKPYFIEN